MSLRVFGANELGSQQSSRKHEITSLSGYLERSHGFGALSSSDVQGSEAKPRKDSRNPEKSS